MDLIVYDEDPDWPLLRLKFLAGGGAENPCSTLLANSTRPNSTTKFLVA